jgi:hypothetical protein
MYRVMLLLNSYCYRLRLGLMVFFCLWATILWGQQAQAGFGIEANASAGRIFKHTAKLKGPIPPLSAVTDINFVWKTYGKAAWQQRRSYPTLGLGFTYSYYDKNIYGQSFAIYPNLALPLIQRNKWEWTIRFGMSLGYVTKRSTAYAPYWDTLNYAVGAHVNNFSLLSSDLRYHLNQHWDVQAGLTFTHMSSAKFRLPNLGINFIGGHIGFRYFPNTANPNKIYRPLNPLSNRFLLQFRQGIAMSTGQSAGSAATPVYLSSLYLSKRYWSKNKVFVGIDYSYHQGIYDFLRIQGIDVGNERKYAWKSGIYIGHEFLYGRAGLLMQLGYYIHQAYLSNPPIYQKLGINWYIKQSETGTIKEICLSTLLKTHYATAELAELGIGIGL